MSQEMRWTLVRISSLNLEIDVFVRLRGYHLAWEEITEEEWTDWNTKQGSEYKSNRIGMHRIKYRIAEGIHWIQQKLPWSRR